MKNIFNQAIIITSSSPLFPKVEDGEYFQTLPENTIFILLRPGEAWGPAGEDIVSQGDDDDDDDDEEHVDVGDDVGGGVGTYWAGWQKLAAFRRGEKMSIKIFVKRAFTIFATDASFLRVIATLQI